MDKLDNVYYINLDHRTDRNDHIISEFTKIKFSNYERFPAIKHEFGALGCALSHLNVLLKFKENKDFKVGMVLEDDAEFLISREEIDKYINDFIQSDAHVLCLAYNIRNDSISDYSAHLLRSTCVQTLSCCLIKKEILNILIDNFTFASKNLKKHYNKKNKIELIVKFAIDSTWKSLQKDYIFTIPKVRAAKQYHSYSDIMNCMATYDV
jgi:glycosyl transferase family 25